jgi:isoleucyl-tRNA synthetase
MREQIRLWFYSQLFMSVALVGRAPFRRRARLREDARRARPRDARLWGNMIEAEDAFERMGADVMRWQFCAQPPDRNLLSATGRARDQAKLLTLWNSVRFLVDYANIEGFGGVRMWRVCTGGAAPLDRCSRDAASGRGGDEATRVF